MDPAAVELAAGLCAELGAADLLEWLELPADCPGDQARAALKRKRAFFQSMQGNPKYRDLARRFIKTYRTLDALLADPAAYAAQARAQRGHAHLPLLEVAIDGVLADGVLTPEEEAFVRESALALGVAPELYEEILRARAQAAGVALPAPAPPPVSVAASISPLAAAPKRHRGAPTGGWWDEAFTQLLGEAVPTDTRRLVDLATGMGWAALALLPDRPELEYLGIDRDAERLRLAEKALRGGPVADRVALMPGSAEELPIPDAAVDVVLCVQALDRVSNVGAVLREAARVLRPGGRLVCVEPDRAALRLWFDGPLPEVEAAFAALARAVDARLAGAGDPDAPGLSLGPLLADRMRRAGLRPVDARVHPVREARLEDMESFAERLDAMIEKLAASGRLGARDPAVAAALAAVEATEARVGGTSGLAASVLPLFLVVGTR